HAMQPQLVEREAEQELHGLAADAAPPLARVAEEEAEGARAVTQVDPLEAAGADVEPAVAVRAVDGEHPARGVATEPLEPALLVGHGERSEHQEVAPHLGIVKPRHEAREVVPLDGAQADAVPDEHAADPRPSRAADQ